MPQVPQGTLTTKLQKRQTTQFKTKQKGLAIPIRMPASFFVETGKSILKFRWIYREPRSQNNFEKEQNCRINTNGFQDLL